MKLHTRTLLATIALGAIAPTLAITAATAAAAPASQAGGVIADGTSNTVNFSWGESQLPPPAGIVGRPLGYTLNDLLISG